MGFNQPATLPLPANTATALTVFRQASYPVWADRSLEFTHVVDYGVDPFPSVGMAAYSEVSSRVTTLGTWAKADRTATATITGVSGIADTYGASWPVFGRDTPGPEYVYVPKGANFGLVVSFAAAPTSSVACNISYEVWSSPDECQITSATVGIAATKRSGYSGTTSSSLGWWIRPTQLIVGTNTDPAPYSYVAITVLVSTGAMVHTDSTSNRGNTAVTSAAKTVHMPLCMPNEFLNSTLPWYAARVTAAAVLGTNVSQLLNKGGTVLGGRVSPSAQNVWQASEAYINALHPAEKAFLPLETGVYTYAPPSTDLVFFSDYTLNTTNGAAAAPVFRLDNASLANKMFITATAVAEQLACTCTWHIEFRTSSALFQIGLSAMTLESLHTAQLVLAEQGFFFENPEHDRLLTRVISSAKKYVPSLVGVVNPAAGRLLTSLVSKMSTVTPKPGPSKPATTTAKGSGMTGKPKSKSPQPKKKTKGKKAK